VKAVMLLKTAEGARWAVTLAGALQRREHEVVFALPSLEGSLPDQVRAAGMEVVVAEAPLVGAGPLRQPRAILRLRRQLTEVLRADVVVSHLYASALAGRLALATTSTPHIYMSAGPLYLENRLIRMLEGGLAQLDDHLICSSQALLDAYRKVGMPRNRLSMIPYPAPARWGDVHRDELRAQTRASFGLEPDDLVFACIAYFYAPKRLVHRGRGIKGHDVLLPAFERYRAAGGRGVLLVVGSGFGPGGEAYRDQMVRRFGHIEGVQWIPGIADVRPYYCAADISVAPSLSENHGAAAEAAALGVPTIASAVGGLPEVVRDGWNGWLVPPDDVGALAGALAEAEQAPAEVLERYGRRSRLRQRELKDEHRNGEAFAEVVERVAAHGRQDVPRAGALA
jgi:glycosyltransferase involved in cell wall biosynthesis